MPCFEFAGLINGDIWFQEAGQTDIEVDTFKRSCPCTINWLKNTDDDFLLINCDGQLEFQTLFTNEVQGCDGAGPSCQPGSKSSETTHETKAKVRSVAKCKFIIQRYKASDLPCDVVPVILATMKQENGKKVVVCCSSDGRVFPEEMDLPDEIGGSKHKALFYVRRVEEKSNTFMFESSLLRSNFLGFQADAGALNKLVLRSKLHKVDEVDENAQIAVIPCNA
ncbi:uncharacterized protein LOC117509401 [Thalassophryne amazonica]|uniref:uncharacterized protein LOC117509401 n=1 Tax=Thalassophryne amazonica TaxID=390379 RepID=UPI0014715254|nr:uncharacterized protein LOC117509401 [Thalassophryne amazonica]